MEPKKNIKKHTLIEPVKIYTGSLYGIFDECEFNFNQEDLVQKITDAANRIHELSMDNYMANWAIMSNKASRIYQENIRDYNIQIGDMRVEDDTIIQDIEVKPICNMDYLTLDFTILPNGELFDISG